jgi:hypothetical protein
MKQIQHFKSTRIRLILIIVLCLGASASYAKPPLFDTNPLYAKIEMIKPGMSKQEVKSILEKPYKISFYTNGKGELVEELFYKSSYILYERFYITYCIEFVNNKLTTLTQQEEVYKEQKIEVVKKE